VQHFSDDDLAALAKRFSVWSGFGDDLAPFVAAGGDDLAKETKGDPHRRVHEWFVGALIQAQSVPSRNADRLERHVKDMLQNAESALKKLVVWIDPTTYRAVRTDGLGTLLGKLAQAGLMPASYTVKDLRPPEKRPKKWAPGEREKAEAEYATEWRGRDAFAHAARDLWLRIPT
jgi:hypothetical protein